MEGERATKQAAPAQPHSRTAAQPAAVQMGRVGWSGRQTGAGAFCSQTNSYQRFHNRRYSGKSAFFSVRSTKLERLWRMPLIL
jgi:hypothetical protein